ncbi:methyltransferase domain-containing protein [Roseibium sp.]|uniref:methyltransferase domain-containing protein n=1 Tax=Roseibium sp. TaxID=1936156 RepID=UPI003BA85FA7
MELRHFKAMNKVHDTSGYVTALEAFDSIPQLRELKVLARQRGGIVPGGSVLDIGCGFGLETLRLANEIGPSGMVSGVDISPDFIAEARSRAEQAEAAIDYRVGDAHDLPFAAASFDSVRAERMLIYLKDVSGALAEMKRVLKPGGRLALIEPDFSTNTINIGNRRLMRRIVDHETAVAVEQSWLPGPLAVALSGIGFNDIEIATRVLIFPQELGATYFKSIGVHAQEAGVISGVELTEWQDDIDRLRDKDQVFATIGYFLFTATAP